MQLNEGRPAPFEPLKSLPLLLGSLFLAVGAVDLLLAIQPSLLISLRGDWQAAMPPGSSVSTLVAAAVITGALALSALTLTWFVRGVRSAPYLCLAPLWVGLCMLVIGRMTTPLPIPLPTPAFVAICALLFVGSGVLFESRSTQNNAVGAGLSALPILLLILGYLLSDVKFDMSAMMLVLVLALAAGGAPVIAIACRANGNKLSGGRSEAQDESEQMMELLERARQAEARAARAESQLGGGPAAWSAAATPPRLALEDDEGVLSRRSGGSPWVTWAVAAAAVAVVGAGYALAYQPLSVELTDQRTRSAKEAEQLNFEMTALRASAARDKQQLEEKLAAAYAAASQGGGSPGAGPGGSPAAASSLALAAAESESRRTRAAADEEDEGSGGGLSESSSSRSEAWAAKKAEWAAKKEAKRQERLAAREARRAERLAKREARLATRREGGAADDSDADEEAEEEREARAAAREAKAAERAAKREARLAAKAEAAGDDEAEEEEAPKPAKRPEPEESSDDPLEGLDGL